MDVDDLILISVDDHLVEPATLFDAHIPDRFRDRAPRIVHTDDGADVWVFGDQVIPNIGLNAVAGRPKEEYGAEPTAWEEMRPGCYDVHERVKDMNAAGVLASLNFPSFPGFAGRVFAAEPDKELALACVRAYNDFVIDEWCGAYPDRFIPWALPVLWDPELCAEEVRRVAAKGCHALTFSENPYRLGFPSYHDEAWDPLWRAVCDEQVVVNVHLGSSGQLTVPAPNAPIDVMITLQPMNIATAAADILWSRVLKEFPDIRFALTEGGTGWVPYFLDRVDDAYDRYHLWTGQDFGDRLPSDVFRQHFLTCFIDDPVGLALIDRIGVDNVCWELDYPHSTTPWPTPGERLLEAAADLTEEQLAKIGHRNAMRWYSFDPFSIRPPERCTVAALRAESPGHDVAVRSMRTESAARRQGVLTATAED